MDVQDGTYSVHLNVFVCDVTQTCVLQGDNHSRYAYLESLRGGFRIVNSNYTMRCPVQVPAIGELVDQGEVDAFIHVGDMAYCAAPASLLRILFAHRVCLTEAPNRTTDSAVDGGAVGDQFMRDLHRASRGRVPVMVAPGNGDVFSCGADDAGQCGCACDYSKRFTMPCPQVRSIWLVSESECGLHHTLARPTGLKMHEELLYTKY
jgi:hypothetical protein